MPPSDEVSLSSMVSRVNQNNPDQSKGGDPKQGSPHRSLMEESSVKTDRTIKDVAEIMGMKIETIDIKTQETIMPLFDEIARLKKQLDYAHHFEMFLGKEADQHSQFPLLNYRAFHRELLRIFSHLEEKSLSGSLILFHIADIEKIRMTYGKTKKDDVLRRIVKLLSHHLTPVDLCSYLDDGDFAIFLTVIEPYEALQKMNKIIDEISSQSYEFSEDKIFLSVRSGYCHHKNGLSPTQAMQFCDYQIITKL
jgi:GGDEF domain-containing protein